MLTSTATALLAEIAGKLHSPVEIKVEIKVKRNMCIVVATWAICSLRLRDPHSLLYRGGEGR